MAAIDRIHGFPLYPQPIRVVRDATLRVDQMAVFRPSITNDYHEIAINVATLNLPAFVAPSFTHEVGHLLDFSLQYGYASEKGLPLLDEWREAIEQSGSCKRLKLLAVNSAVLSPRDQAMLRYLLLPREMFARSYAQFVAQTSQEASVAQWLNYLQKEAATADMPEQWTEQDFRPIAECFLRLLRGVQYRK